MFYLILWLCFQHFMSISTLALTKCGRTCTGQMSLCVVLPLCTVMLLVSYSSTTPNVHHIDVITALPSHYVTKLHKNYVTILRQQTTSQNSVNELRHKTPQTNYVTKLRQKTSSTSYVTKTPSLYYILISSTSSIVPKHRWMFT